MGTQRAVRLLVCGLQSTAPAAGAGECSARHDGGLGEGELLNIVCERVGEGEAQRNGRQSAPAAAAAAAAVGKGTSAERSSVSPATLPWSSEDTTALQTLPSCLQ